MRKTKAPTKVYAFGFSYMVWYAAHASQRKEWRYKFWSLAPSGGKILRSNKECNTEEETRSLPDNISCSEMKQNFQIESSSQAYHRRRRHKLYILGNLLFDKL